MKIFMQLKLNFLLPDLSNGQLYMPTNDASQRARGRHIGPLKDVIGLTAYSEVKLINMHACPLKGKMMPC